MPAAGKAGILPRTLLPAPPMKPLVILAALACLVLGWYLASPRPEPPAPDARPGQAPPAPFSSTTAPAEVFQKAFWKRPTAGDTILHAERREWQGAAGVTRWQWFLSVRPGPDLVRHLITENAFMLVKTGDGALPPLEGPPDWFPASEAGFEVMANPSRSFRLLWDREENLLHATDSGGGFQPGAPEPAPAPPVSGNTPGRLPLTPPPNPGLPQP